MKLYEKSLGDCSIVFNSDSTVKITKGDLSIHEEVTSENVMDTILTILMSWNIDLDGDTLNSICENIIALIDEGLTNDYPHIEVEGGTLHYIAGNITFKRQEDIYSSKKICKVIKTEDNYINETSIKLYLLKNEINVGEKQFAEFLKEIMEYDNENTVINITKDNMQDYIDRVPKEIMCIFLNEYFNGRK